MPGGRAEQALSAAYIVPCALCRHSAREPRRRDEQHPCLDRSTRTGASPCEQQHGIVAAAEPGRTIRRGQEPLDLRSGQKVHLPPVVALARDRKHALDECAVSRLLEGYEPEERANSGQAQVARLDARPAPRL